MTAPLLLALTHTSAAVLGVALGYLLGRRAPRRHSSLDLGGNGGSRCGRGRHRDR